MGSKSSKSSSTASTSTTSTSTNTETIQANSTDNEGISVIADGGVNLNITSGEAFQLAADVTTNALQSIKSSNAETLQGAVEFAEKQNKEILDFATKNASPATETIKTVVKYATLASVSYFAFKIYGK